MLNRAAVLVRPKEPYLKWAGSLDDSGILPDRNGERTVYLIPDFDDDEQGQAILRDCFDLIFESELYGWHTDEPARPRRRTFEMFLEWFEVELNSVVLDLCDHELEDDEELEL